MAKSVKGTQTEKNLLTSFAGESQARMRYTYFASTAKKEEAKSKAERERIGKWEPERMENGETLPQIVAEASILY